MKIVNDIKYISNDLIQDIANDLGLSKDISLRLYTPERESIKATYFSFKDGHLIGINKNKIVDAGVIAHELRHAFQAEVLGLDIFDVIYEVETEFEGYKNNILEVDAREYADKFLRVA